MRRVAPAAAAVAALSIAASSSASGMAPAVTVPDLRPFTVHGLRFRAHEHVRVVLRTRRTFRREVEASGTGSFRVVFRRARVRDCQAYGVRATGDRGSRAVTKNTRELCGPAPGPTG